MVKARGRQGEKHEYLRLVESVWQKGRSHQRIIANLGRKDLHAVAKAKAGLLAPHLDDLVRLLQDRKGEGPPAKARRAGRSALKRLP